MKKLSFYILPLYLATLLITGCVRYEGGKISQPESIKGVAEYVTAPENNGYKIGVQNFDVALANNINTDKALQYKLGDKYLAMKPVAIKADGKQIKTIQAKNALMDTKKYAYSGIFGEGIDLDMNFGERVWNKVIKIDRLNRLGTIASKVKNVEIWFELDTNFVVDGWDKQSYFEIKDKVRLGDYSYLEPAYIWDSYSEEVCHEECETACDPTCTDDNLCDVCDPCQQRCEVKTNKIKIVSYLTTENGKKYYVKQIPVEWLKTAQFPVATDADITYGSAQDIYTSFNGSYGAAYHVVAIDTDKFVVCYFVNSGNGPYNCYAGTVSDTTITLGSAAEMVNNPFLGHSAFNLCKLDTDKFVGVYTDDTADDDGYARAATVSTRTITFGTAKEFYDGDAENVSCGAMGTDKFAIAYNDEGNGDDGYAMVCTTSGTTITCGSASEFADAITLAKYNKVCGLQDATNDSFAVIYEDDANTSAEARVATTTGTTINSWGTNAVLEDTDVAYTDCATLSDSKFVGVWGDLTGDEGESVICTVDSSQNLSCGSLVEFGSEAGDTYYNSPVKIDDSHFVVAYEDLGNSEKGTTNYSSFSGTTITQGGEEVFFNAQTAGADIDLLSANKIILCYVNDVDDVVECMVGTTPSAPPATGTNYGTIIIFD